MQQQVVPDGGWDPTLFTWVQGKTLSDALAQMLGVAMPRSASRELPPAAVARTGSTSSAGAAAAAGAAAGDERAPAAAGAVAARLGNTPAAAMMRNAMAVAARDVTAERKPSAGPRVPAAGGAGAPPAERGSLDGEAPLQAPLMAGSLPFHAMLLTCRSGACPAAPCTAQLR
jgi:hypothetical protein